MRIINAGKVQAAYMAKRRMAKGQEESNEASGKSSASNLKIRPGEKLGDFYRRVEQAMASDIAATARSDARKVKKRKRAAATAASACGGGDDDQIKVGGEGAECKRKERANRAAALKQAETSARNLKKTTEKTSAASSSRNKGEAPPLDFAKAPQIRSVNDVADAPPTFTKLPRGKSKEAKARKTSMAAALAGKDPKATARKTMSSREKTVTAGQMPEPVAAKGCLRREKELREERDRAIKLYRQRKEQAQGQRS